MFRIASPATLRLARGHLLTWRQGRVRLRVLAGSAWVTRPGDLDDHFLQPGQTLELSHGLIGAEQDLWLSVESPRRALAAAWHWLVHRRLQCGGEQSQISLHLQ